jgi:hypothetical protein
MVKELESIDTSSFRALAEIRQDELVLQGLLEKATAQKEKVSKAVFQRVSQDYTVRLQALENRAKPLRVTARAELAKLNAVRDQLKTALDVAQVNHEELQFRLQVGELRQEDYDTRQKSLTEALSAAQQAFDEVERVCKQFADVVPLEPPPAAAAGAAEPPTADIAGRKDAPPPPAAAEPPKDVDADAELGTVKVARKDLKLEPEFGTMAVSLAQLVQERDDGPPTTHELGAICNIGRVAENHVAIDKPEVSRNHARIAKGDTGWILTDLGSGNGTYANGKRVKEHKLKSGDKIRIGTTHFVFQSR